MCNRITTPLKKKKKKEQELYKLDKSKLINNYDTYINKLDLQFSKAVLTMRLSPSSTTSKILPQSGNRKPVKPVMNYDMSTLATYLHNLHKPA